MANMKRRGLLTAFAAFVATLKGGQEVSEPQEMTGVMDVCDLNPEYCSSTGASISYTEPEPFKCTNGEITIGHDWKSSAWIIWDDNLEVPEYYSPGKIVRIEVCARCGFIRVPPDSLKEVVEQGK